MSTEPNKLRELSEKIANPPEACHGNEEATRTALIEPFFEILGYDVRNPDEFYPEYTADVGIKKGEKIDYAIRQDGKPIVIIECKSINTKLDIKEESQLFRYFSTIEDCIAILTNGNEYRFYADLERKNIMDQEPFLVFDLSDEPYDYIDDLKQFTKSNFDAKKILTEARIMKYTRETKKILSNAYRSPNDKFVKFLTRQVYSGNMTSSIVEDFREIVKKAFSEFVYEQHLLRVQLDKLFPKVIGGLSEDTLEEESVEENSENKVVTTQEELDGFYIVKAILRETIDPSRISMRDVKSYCGVLLDNNNRKPICRLHFNRTQKYIGVFDQNKSEEQITIDNLDDIYRYADRLKAAAKSYSED